MDISLEVINVLKNIVDLHVLIEIHPGSKNINIIDVVHLPDNKTLVPPNELLSKEQYKYLEPYFKGVKSVHFAVHSKKTVRSSLKASYNILHFIRKIKPDVLHLEALFLIRTISLVPSLLFLKKLVMSIHDPIPHSGEKDRKEAILKFIYFNFPIKKRYLFYSHYAKSQFEKFHKKDDSLKEVLQMSSYTYFNKIIQPLKVETKHILFFGRLSKYKGINILLEALPSVLNEFPDEILVIAGKPINDYKLNNEIISKYKKNIVLIKKYISNVELVQLIRESKFIICPYIDATQSGVLMTSFALNTPVIASSVGAFPEYIKESVNGFLVSPGNIDMLSTKIKLALKDNFYVTMKKNIEMEDKNQWSSNESKLLRTYLT